MAGFLRAATAPLAAAVMTALIVGTTVQPQAAQQPGGRGGQAPGAQQVQPPSPRAAAPVDVTGTWVAVVTEDWRWRMVTPPKGDYASVPLNPEGRRIADTWEPSQDGSCRAYGVGGLMRMPGRVRISWENDTTLKIESDAGQQTRLLHFDRSVRPGTPSLQGHSVAEWELPPAGRGRGGAAPQGTRWAPLKVVTTNMLPGWLRRNGVPYSEGAVITERFLRFSEDEAGDWFTVTTLVEDPTYLAQPFITSSNFKRESDDSRWNPTPCRS